MTPTEILEELGIEYQTEHKNVRSGWAGLDCVLCGSTECHLGMNLTTGSLCCWHCGWIKHSFKVLAELAHVQPRVVGDLFTQFRHHQEHNAAPYDSSVRRKLTMPGGILDQPTSSHTKYLKSRGLSRKDAVLWGLQYTGPTGEHKWRIVIPIYYRGEIVSWTTRSIAKEPKRRYLAAKSDQEKMDPRRIVFGIDFVRSACIVTEGPFDAMRIGVGACSTFGIGWTNPQLALIAQVPVRAIVYDSEERAQKKAEELCRALEPMAGETHLVKLDTGKDPGSCSSEEIKELRNRFLRS